MTVHDTLQDVFRTVFLDEDLELSDQTTAADIPGWDSVAHINLMFAIEQTFGVRFPGNELAEFRDIGELKAFLEKGTEGRRDEGTKGDLGGTDGGTAPDLEIFR